MNHLDYTGNFPYDRHPQMRAGQRIALAHLANATEWPVVHQSPVGTGKTALGIAFLTTHVRNGARCALYSTTNKTQVEQVASMFPGAKRAFGRSEHPCLYPKYSDGPRADEIPCSMNTDCPHRVNLDTGETHTPGATPCPYLQQKYDAMQGGIVVCTHAFLVFNVLLSQAFKPEAVVIDEVHRLAQSFRSVLSTEITDLRIMRAMETVEEASPRQFERLAAFLTELKRSVRRNALDVEKLLEDDEIEKLYAVISAIDSDRLARDTRMSISKGKLDPVTDRELIQQIEVLVRSIRRFQHALRFAIAGQAKGGYPLAYVIASGKSELGPAEMVQYRLTIRDYYVVPLIKKVLPEATYAYSATIVDPEILGNVTGIRGSYLSIPSDFPAENTRLYMPTDTPDLAVKARNRRDKTKALRRIARTAKRFSEKGLRSLVIVISNEERLKFLEMAREEGFECLSYGNGIRARESALAFRNGAGQCLVGTAAHFGEGLDLPAQVAPVTFMLRPGYPHPDDPQTQFEERRFRSRRWKLWQWGVMLEMLQVRGRNVRSATDLGVTFLVSQQFRNFAFGSLPDWLQGSYRGSISWEACVSDAEKLLAPK